MAIIKRILVKLALSFFGIVLFQSCQNSSIEPQLGNYRAEMITKDGSVLPFRFELIKDSDQLIMKVDNDKETLIYDDIRFENDSIKILIRSVWWMMDERHSFGTFQQAGYEAESLELALSDELQELKK